MASEPNRPPPQRPTRGWHQRLPNALTIARLVLAAAFVLVLSLPWARPGATAWLLFAAALFVIAAITDALDGHLARRLNAITRFGRVMDPFADKILVLSAYILLAGPAFRLQTDAGPIQASGVHAWMVALLLARELLVTSLRGLVESEGGDFSAGALGKLKMIAQSVAAPLALAILSFDDQGDSHALLTLIALGVVGITMLSAVPYVRRAMQASDQST
ncbi:MAG: CDP-alcohol phosphatidyltransferase family protein [Planctomycetota bacterium]